jgi:hypothetical protein
MTERGRAAMPLPGAGVAIASLAMLKVNSDQGHDYIDGFVPFAAECLRQGADARVSLEELDTCFSAEYGLSVPLPALKTILHRAARDGLLQIDFGTYVRTDALTPDSEFKSARSDALRQHRALIDRLKTFAKDRHQVDWTDEQTQSVLFSHVQDHAVPILSAAIEGTPISSSSAPRVRSGNYIVSDFILDIAERDPEQFGYLETLVKGAMLASVLFFPDLGQVTRRFDRLDAYFDTPLLLRAIGAHGVTAERSARQVVGLAYELGIRPRCFKSTFDETFGVLNAAARELRRYGAFTMETSDTIEYLLGEGFEASDVELLIAKLETVLDSLHIEVVERPEPDPALTLDEVAFESALQDEVQYRRPEALKHDLDAATAIYRLRSGELCRTLEQARAIFVTTNSSLARGSRLFFRDVYQGTGVPVITVDHHFGTLLWLKKPTAAPDLPRDLLIASCYAALNPPDQLWHKYLAEIERLRVRGNLSAEDYHLLRFDLSSKSSLLTLTGGRQDAFVDGTVEEVLRRARANASREAEEVARLNEERAERAETSELASTARTKLEREQRQARYRQVGNVVGAIARRAILGVAFVIALVAGLSTEGLLTGPIRVAIVAVGALISAAAVFGWSLGKWVRDGALGIEVEISRSVAKRLEVWMEPSSQSGIQNSDGDSDELH